MKIRVKKSIVLEKRKILTLIILIFLFVIQILISQRIHQTDTIEISISTEDLNNSSLFVNKTISTHELPGHTLISQPIELNKSARINMYETGFITINTKMPYCSTVLQTSEGNINQENYLIESISNEVLLPADINYSLFRPVSSEDIEYLANNEISIGDKTRPIVIMTYDDGGPAEYVEHIMSVYEAFNFRATFFITGVWAEKNRELVKDMIDRGFTIGCHGWDHSEMTVLSEEAVRKQIADFLILMNQIDESYEIRFIRFPYGSRNQNIRYIAAEFGLQSIMWTCGSGGIDENTLNYIMRCLTKGSIILSHSTRWYDVYETKKILQALVNLGYEAVTICDGLEESEIFQDKNTDVCYDMIE